MPATSALLAQQAVDGFVLSDTTVDDPRHEWFVGERSPVRRLRPAVGRPRDRLVGRRRRRRRHRRGRRALRRLGHRARRRSSAGPPGPASATTGSLGFERAVAAGGLAVAGVARGLRRPRRAPPAGHRRLLRPPTRRPRFVCVSDTLALGCDTAVRAAGLTPGQRGRASPASTTRRRGAPGHRPDLRPPADRPRRRARRAPARAHPRRPGARRRAACCSPRRSCTADDDARRPTVERSTRRSTLRPTAPVNQHDQGARRHDNHDAVPSPHLIARAGAGHPRRWPVRPAAHQRRAGRRPEPHDADRARPATPRPTPSRRPRRPGPRRPATRVEVSSPRDMNQQLAQGFAGGDPPDVFYLDAASSRVRRGRQPRTPTATSIDDTDDFYPALARRSPTTDQSTARRRTSRRSPC